MKLRIRESDMKYNTYGNWNRAYDILVGEKGYTPDEAQEIISNIQRDYKYNPNSNDSIMRRIKQVLPKDEYEKEFRIKDTFGESKLREQDVEIEVKNKGILEVPEDKNVDDLPMSHFEKLVKKHGLSKITKALNNLQVWNKNDDKELSKWAGNMIDKLTNKFGKNESLKEDTIDGVYVDIDSLSRRYRKMMLSGELDDIVALYHEVGGDFDEFVIEALQRGFSKLDIMCFSMCNDGMSINNFKNRLRMLNMLDESLKEYYDAQDFDRGTEDMFNYDGSDMYDDIPDEPYTEEDEFNYYVDYVYNHTRNPQEAKRYLRSEGKSKEYIDQVIAAVDEIYG